MATRAALVAAPLAPGALQRPAALPASPRLACSARSPRSTLAVPQLQRLVPAARQQRRLPPPAASGGSEQEPAAGQQPPAAPGGGSGPDGGSLLASLGLWGLWAGLAGYAFLVAPNQTPLRDAYFLEKLVGLGVDDGVTLNAIVTNLFLVMGVWPLIYTSLLIPSGKSDNGVPAWPFVTLSYGIGAFGLLPFMALWQPPRQPPKVPADAADLQGWQNLMQKGMESPVVAVLCLAGATWCVAQAALAGPQQWNAYFRLLEESRFINVMTCDFLCLCALAPFWMANDAQLRNWDKRDSLLPILSVLPLFGPAIYLCLRPRAQP
ncbi:hypothetical protein C2E21_3280 [Chlorella sorokiniana]|uniref:Uncharacterized protein n=1 Tax=Chlorella sorokiniana TaxID=3076 RepID=A0A2P6TXA7_CHLSO|nr:hypothetical protein C2E21_3280 [Chlorella sorokiniana]|eukprot:PRW58694.1 hypothetical protein C2E21_3280 [Chlorella sorokiniana]